MGELATAVICSSRTTRNVADGGVPLPQAVSVTNTGAGTQRLPCLETAAAAAASGASVCRPPAN
jgi:hypothetical protein